MPITLQRFWYKLLGLNPARMPMVRYWKTKVAVSAKLTQENGQQVMYMEGEDEPFVGYPRGHILYGRLSKLKHEIKNQLFNESWALLDEQKPIAGHIESRLTNIFALLDSMRYDLVPPSKLAPPIAEIHRAWTKAVPGETSYKLRDVVCFILQEDDAYRNRVQWLAGWIRWGNPLKVFDKALWWMEHGEVISDMKERQRLLRRVLMALLQDPRWRAAFTAFYKECDWKKVRLTKADKYHFRAKYFKVDLDKFEY